MTEPKFISINVLQNLEIIGLGQIRSKIVRNEKDGEIGKWNSIDCKKLKNNSNGINNWHINLDQLIYNLENNTLKFKNQKISKLLLAELKLLYPEYDKKIDKVINIEDKRKYYEDINLNDDIQKNKKIKISHTQDKNEDEKETYLSILLKKHRKLIKKIKIKKLK